MNQPHRALGPLARRFLAASQASLSPAAAPSDRTGAASPSAAPDPAPVPGRFDGCPAPAPLRPMHDVRGFAHCRHCGDVLYVAASSSYPWLNAAVCCHCDGLEAVLVKGWTA